MCVLQAKSISLTWKHFIDESKNIFHCFFLENVTQNVNKHANISWTILSQLLTPSMLWKKGCMHALNYKRLKKRYEHRAVHSNYFCFVKCYQLTGEDIQQKFTRSRYNEWIKNGWWGPHDQSEMEIRPGAWLPEMVELENWQGKKEGKIPYGLPHRFLLPESWSP